MVRSASGPHPAEPTLLKCLRHPIGMGYYNVIFECDSYVKNYL